jgi:hypothetical protein
MMKKWQKTGFSGTKNSKNDGLSKFLGHVSPTFDDSSDPLGHKKNTWAS